MDGHHTRLGTWLSWDGVPQSIQLIILWPSTAFKRIQKWLKELIADSARIVLTHCGGYKANKTGEEHCAIQSCIIHIQGFIGTEREFPINIIFIDVELGSFIKFIEATAICGSNLSVLIFNIWWVQLQIILLTINSSHNKQSLLNYWFLIFIIIFASLNFNPSPSFSRKLLLLPK